ncbi:hypothetical protein A5784_11115 [Mycobacterium sp. 852013-50091_SCH5140682]|nr:hypothetical protein A5784_11115 [Mycobacterium sp. 852013-50091_SCH5140682]
MDNSAGQLDAAAAGAELELLDELLELLEDDAEDEAFSDELELSELLAEPLDELLPESRLSVR